MERTLPRLLTLCLLAACVAGPSRSNASDPDADPRARIKRVALTVPDLDAATGFFRDVLGFRVDSVGVLAPGDDPYLPKVFNFAQDRPLRRALFSTATEARGLFVLEVPGMAVPEPGAASGFALVVETSDLAALVDRARAAGHESLPPQEGRTPDGGRYREVLVIGPARLRVLTFEYAR